MFGILTRIRKAWRKRKAGNQVNIFVACFPKSGSTYLTTLMRELTGFPFNVPVQFTGPNEQDILETKFALMCEGNSVTQQHVKATRYNLSILKKHGVKPVVLVRNIYDTLVSWRDHIEQRTAGVPTGYVHKEYFTMTEEERFRYLIRVHLPWHFSFFVSWREAGPNMPVLWITYEQLFSDQVATVKRIIEYYGLTYSDDQIMAAIGRMSGKDTRLNVGKSGRGQALSEANQAAIEDLARVWKRDMKEFSIIGIGPQSG